MADLIADVVEEFVEELVGGFVEGFVEGDGRLRAIEGFPPGWAERGKLGA